MISTMSGSPWGGSEELWAATALEALDAGHEVLVSVLGWTNKNKLPKLQELERRGAKVFYRNNADSQSQKWSFAGASGYRELFLANPDVLLISQGSCFDVVAISDLLELLYLTPIPFVLVCQLNFDLPVLADDCRRMHACNVFSRAFRVLFVSSRNKIEAERQLAMKIPNSDLVLNPVNLSDRSYLPWPESRTARLASVARLEAKFKGQDILIEALSADKWTQRDWHLTLYGCGPDESYLRSIVEFFGLQRRITFAGYQSDVRAIWTQEQLLIMFSRAEGTPLALVEAMLCGRPAVVSDVGGNTEWITEAQTGFVAEAPVIGLARVTLERAWSARQCWNTMGIEAHRFATRRAGDLTIRGLLDVLLEACRQRRGEDPASSAGIERLGQYRRLIKPTIVRQAMLAATVAALRLKNTLRRWQPVRERSLLRLAESRRTERNS
jgi:L-malate glycosyltransferase